MRFNLDPRSRLPSLKMVFVVIIAVLIVSTAIIRYYDNKSWIDSFFLVIDSMTHAHFGTYPEATTTKFLMVFLTVFGYGLLIYFISFLVEFFVSGQLMEVMGMRRIDKEIGRMMDHIILCGYGRVVSVVGMELRDNKIPFVVIDKVNDIIEKLRSEG
ncbi:MAG TPA: hypothetical protein PLC12_06350, partial [Candidatus Methanofastidiosa archaeon]|nr:hypothetical protein [Candidatus Methanofastidiosa archaeon]